MFGQPWYRGYPSNGSHNPYVYSPYQRSSPFDPTPIRNSGSYGLEEAAQERARALAEQRARRAQYLPDEVDEDDDDWEYNQFGPRERAYLEAQRRRAVLERKQQEEVLARQRELEEREWQKELEKRQREDEEVRQRLLEDRKRQLRLKREEEARRMAAAAMQEKVLSDSLLPPVTESDQKPRPLQMQQQQAKAQMDGSRSGGNGHPPTQLPSSPSEPSIPISESKSDFPTSRPPTPKSPPKPRHSSEEQNEAASRIQNCYRIHSSFRTLDNINKEFETLKKTFVYPRTIDFQKPGSDEGHISVLAFRPPSDFDSEDGAEPMGVDGPEGKLDFTSTNFALNTYSDALDKLLMKLDGVESWGKKGVREKRRTIVKSIEKEASKLDRYWKQAWVDYLAKETSASQSEPRGNVEISP